MTTRDLISTATEFGLPAPLAEPVQRWLARLSEKDDQIADFIFRGDCNASTLLRLGACSEYAATALVRHRDWFLQSHTRGDFDQAVTRSTLSDFIQEIGNSDRDINSVKASLRQFRHKILIHILWRSINGADDVWKSLQSLSDLADSFIQACVMYGGRALSDRFGQPGNQQGERIQLIVLAMGKLGGSELNFSSDVDVIFLYSDDGETDGARTLSSHEYFTRLSRLVVSLLDDVTEDGFVYRVDTRLRPFGDSGPPVVSFAALESYLLQHARAWERYAYVKARVVCPPEPMAVTEDLRALMIEPFVYRRYLDFGVFEALREMRTLIATEVQNRNLLNNVKLGPGGIREIEFIVQSVQLVRGGANKYLRCQELRSALQRLGDSRGLGGSAVATLTSAYEFLRKLENAIQAIRDQQTHDVPTNPADQARLLVALGYHDWPTLLAELERHRSLVSKQFEAVAFRNDTEPGQSDFVREISTHWAHKSSVEEWAELLAGNDCSEAKKVAHLIVEFGETLNRAPLDVSSLARLDHFMVSFLPLLKGRRRPELICDRVLKVVSQIVRRSAYVALLNENPAVLERLVGLCSQSDYLAREIAQFPLLLDELLDARIYTADISVSSMREDLSSRFANFEPEDSEGRVEVLAEFQRATLFRIAIADFSGNLPIMKVSDRLTELAEIVVSEALTIAWTDLVRRHGEPTLDSANSQRKAGFGVIAYGKLGGMELSYGSDLDLVFVHDSNSAGQETNGSRPLENSMFFARLARRLVHFLTAQTGSGAMYKVDTRLRPSGRSGLLVVNTNGFQKYQEDNAWTWEHQALLRSRPIAGSAVVAREFARIRKDTLQRRVHVDQLMTDVVKMRQKMREQLDKSIDEVFDLKQGAGGIGDIEFLVQFLVLKNAANEPALIHYTDNIRQLGMLEAVGCLSAGDTARLQETYKSYRRLVHRLALDGQSTVVRDSEFVDDRKFVTSVWQREMNRNART